MARKAKKTAKARRTTRARRTKKAPRLTRSSLGDLHGGLEEDLEQYIHDNPFRAYHPCLPPARGVPQPPNPNARPRLSRAKVAALLGLAKVPPKGHLIYEWARAMYFWVLMARKDIVRLEMQVFGHPLHNDPGDPPPPPPNGT